MGGSVTGTGGMVTKLVAPTSMTVDELAEGESLPQATNPSDAAATTIPIPTSIVFIGVQVRPEGHTSGRAVGAIGLGSSVSPMSHLSTPAAQARPSAMAHTIRLWPRPMSPATNTPGTLVM